MDALVGWRVWRVRDGVLHATVWDTAWEPQERLDAMCHEAPHAAPHSGCDCGVYAFKRREEAEFLAREKVDHDVLALGRVSLWGRVVETERGYRAEHAYPYELELLGGSEELARRIRQRYAVDVTTGSAVVPLHGGGG